VHLAAHDPQRHVLARIAVALYWFHPLAWLAARQATAAREQACDERVLALGTRPSAYARALLDLSEAIQSPLSAATLPIVQKSLLEARVMAILNGTIRPSSAPRGVTLIVGIAAITVGVAVATPGAARPGNDTRWVETSPSLATPALAVTHPEVLLSTTSLQRGNDRSRECWSGVGADSFSGSMSTTGRNLVLEQIGTLNDTHRVALFTADGVRLCMFGEDVGPADLDEPPSRWIRRGKRVIIESSRGATTQRLTIEGGNTQQALWQVNGVTRNVDRSAEEWRDRMLATLDAYWELTTLRGEQTTRRGQITSIRGEETSLRGEITSLRGEVTSMRGRITSIRGQETSMRGRITSILGHETSLRAQITSARGAITSINASRYAGADADRRIAEYERQIERIEREITDYNAAAKVAAIEKEIAAFDADRKIEEIEKQIDEFAVERKVAEIERRIADLKVDDKVREIERAIEALDIERRSAALEKRIEAERGRLKAAIAALR
jgi:hypothetical protein